MTDDYTPTTEEVRGIWLDAMTETSEYFDALSPAEARARFDRWLEAHDREVADKALEDAAAHLPFTYMGVGTTWHQAQEALLARVAELRSQA